MELVRRDANMTGSLVVVQSVLLRRQALATLLCAKDQRVINYVRLRA